MRDDTDIKILSAKTKQGKFILQHLIHSVLYTSSISRQEEYQSLTRGREACVSRPLVRKWRNI